MGMHFTGQQNRIQQMCDLHNEFQKNYFLCQRPKIDDGDTDDAVDADDNLPKLMMMMMFL